MKQIFTPKDAALILRDTPIDIRSTREDDIHTIYATAMMMAIEALEAADKYKGHDLRKDPEDLPGEEKNYLLKIQNDCGDVRYVVRHYFPNTRQFFVSNGVRIKVIARKEIESFGGEAE